METIHGIFLDHCEFSSRRSDIGQVLPSVVDARDELHRRPLIGNPSATRKQRDCGFSVRADVEPQLIA
jgi:hypothetical protein